MPDEPRPKPRLLGSTDPAEGDWMPGGNPWLLVGTIIGAKVATIVVILGISFTAESGGLVAATSWHWLLLIAVLVAGPAAFWWRLRRVRARRAALQRAEWMIEPAPAAPARKSAADR